MNPGFLTPITINDLILANRAVVAPMCQYSAVDGFPSPWHFGHFHQLAMSGAGMLMLECTAITMSGRITHHDLAISSGEHFIQTPRQVEEVQIEITGEELASPQRELLEMMKLSAMSHPLLLKIAHYSPKVDELSLFVQHERSAGR